MEGDIDQGISYYKKALYYNWHYADAMYNLGVAYGEMLKFDMVSFYFYERISLSLSLSLAHLDIFLYWLSQFDMAV